MKRVFALRGFIVHSMLMDEESECFCADLAEEKIDLNICPNNKSVGELERMIPTIKERARGIYNTFVAVGINKLPGRLVVELIYTNVF